MAVKSVSVGAALRKNRSILQKGGSRAEVQMRAGKHGSLLLNPNLVQDQFYSGEAQKHVMLNRESHLLSNQQNSKLQSPRVKVKHLQKTQAEEQKRKKDIMNQLSKFRTHQLNTGKNPANETHASSFNQLVAAKLKQK